MTLLLILFEDVNRSCKLWLGDMPAALYRTSPTLKPDVTGMFSTQS